MLATMQYFADVERRVALLDGKIAGLRNRLKQEQSAIARRGYELLIEHEEHTASRLRTELDARDRLIAPAGEVTHATG